MKKHKESGSSLLLVVLILLVLSGFGAAMLTLTDSDRTAVSMDDHFKDAFYVAEMGLRIGETTLLATDPIYASNLLGHAPVAQTKVVTPNTPVFPQSQSDYDLSKLGTYLIDAGGQELANRRFSLPAAPSGATTTRAFYSLYIRNNPSDPSVVDGNAGTVAQVDNDETVDLVSVGWITQGGKVLSVKILEEEYSWLGLAAQLTKQKGMNAGNLNSGQYGGN